VPAALSQLANSLLLDGDELLRNGTSLSRYYQRLERSPSSIATATKGLGMGRATDPVRALVTSDRRDRAALAFGPSAGLVLGVSIGAASVRAALVDANGFMHNPQETPPLASQLSCSPSELFDRVRTVSESVLSAAFENRDVLVSGAVPFLGISVAWPVPLDTEKIPRAVLSHREWRANMHGIDQRLARHLHIDRERSHALNDAAAATCAVAFDQTRLPDYPHHTHSQQLIVVRIGGGVGASTVVVEPLQRDGDSGWMNSRLSGGHRGLSGEIGHAPMDQTLLTALKKSSPRGIPSLKRATCSCAEPSEHPDHVEAYIGASALVSRFKRRGEDASATLSRILSSASHPPHLRALEETGIILANCLLSSVLMLSPNEIVLTGRLATPQVAEALEAHLDASESLSRIFGGAPPVRALSGRCNDFIRVRGAALAVLRRHVHRRLDYLFDAPKKLLPARFAELTEPLTAFPWSK
jgi:predicted NBD/HSP70 family sugar kinase